MLTMLSCTPTKERVSTNDATSQGEVVSQEITEDDFKIDFHRTHIIIQITGENL